MRPRFLYAVLTAMLALLPLAAATPVAGVGIATFTVRDPVAGQPMAAVVFYPAAAVSQTTVVGPYAVAASPHLPVAEGRFPMIVFSHGTGGSRWDLHDWASGLARRGFLVASLDHPGDNFRDHSGLGKDTVLIGRELQMSALIGAVLKLPQLQGHTDVGRIGAAGFSAGGYTALLLAGARPNFDLLRQYCRDYPKDPEFCTGWSVAITRPDLKAQPDPRVRAIFAMAPVGIYFNRAGLAGVHVPVSIVVGGADAVLPRAANAARIRAELPRPPEYRVIPGAGHFVFLSPCSATLRAQAPLICNDPLGVDRATVHAQLVEEAARFFRAHLPAR